MWTTKTLIRLRGLRWAHMPEGTFSDIAAQIIPCWHARVNDVVNGLPFPVIISNTIPDETVHVVTCK